MLRKGKGIVYLEPGEIAALAALARQAAPKGPATHPRALMLAAVSEVLSELTDGPGVVIALAPQSVVHQAAQAYRRRPADEHLTPAGPTPAGTHRVRLA